MGNIDISQTPLVVETWLAAVVSDNGTHGFHLPDFNLTPNGINTITKNAWRNWLSVTTELRAVSEERQLHRWIPKGTISLLALCLCETCEA